MLRKAFYKLLLVATVILSLLVLCDAVMARGRSEEAFRRVKEAHERHIERLMEKKGVVGTAIGLDQTGQIAIKVFTDRHGVAGIAKKLDDIPVHLVVTGKIVALNTGRFARPVPVGVSTGNRYSCSAGTIACRVTDGTYVYALSNNHVYALENTAPIGSEVLQPGLYDTGCSYDQVNVIGTLDDFEPIVFRRWARNEIDAAIALSSTASLGTATPDDGYRTPSSETATASVGLAIQKYGRTTGLTSGEITAINATVNVDYNHGTARFVKQIIIESETQFIGAGDSGSLLVTGGSNVNPVGLLFAGTGNGLLAVANPIDLVLERFGVTVDSRETPLEEQPVADFVGEPRSGYAPLNVAFLDISEGAITSWTWDFGGQETSTEQDPFHTYQSAGDYTVSLTVTGPGGSDGEIKENYITVTTPPPAPEAYFIGDPTSGDAPLIVNFTDQSSGNITEWSWDFGDGGISAAHNPSYTYLSAGTYTVSLTVTGPGGSNTETKSDYINVTSPPEIEVFFDSFESSADWTANWSQDSQNDWRRRTARRKEGRYAAEVDGRAMDARLISKVIDLQDKTNATITFWWFIESGLDTGEYLAFDVSADGGPWDEKARLRGNVDAENRWHNVSINITGINNNNLSIRFRGKMSSSREDAYIDVVKVIAW